jgi:plasmid stabilization system protein ParE
MARNLVYSAEAERAIENLAYFIGNTQGAQAHKTFRKKLETTLLLLIENPNLHPSYPLPPYDIPYRRAVVNKKTLLFYYFDTNNVYIDAVYDSRSNWQEDIGIL